VAGEAGGEALSLCVGLSQKGMQRLLFAGRPPNTGSQSNERFRVAHAIFSSVANTSHTKQTLFHRLSRKYALHTRNRTRDATHSTFFAYSCPWERDGRRFHTHRTTNMAKRNERSDILLPLVGCAMNIRLPLAGRAGRMRSGRRHLSSKRRTHPSNPIEISQILKIHNEIGKIKALYNNSLNQMWCRVTFVALSTRTVQLNSWLINKELS
jgi:hypothetical protein